MKNIFLIAVLFFNVVVFADENLFAKYFSVDFLLDLEAKSDFRTENPFELKNKIFGTKLYLPYFNANYYQKNDKKNYGFAFCSNDLFLVPVQVKIGKLNPSGNISSLNSPALSTSISPFSAATNKPKYLNASLPTTSSFSKPFSYFAQVDYKNKDFFINDAKLNFFMIDTNTFYSSLFTKIPLAKKITLNFSLLAGLFEQKTQNHFAGIFQSGIVTKKIDSCINLNLYQKSQNEFAWTFRSDNLFKLNRFFINTDFFINTNDEFTTSSQKKMTECFQAKLGAQYRFVVKGIKPLFFNAGINSYFKSDFTKDEFSTKISAGIKLTTSSYNGSVVFLVEGIKKEFFEIESYNLQFKNSFWIKNVKPTINLTLDYEPQKESLLIKNNLNFLISQKYPITSTNSVSFYTKQNELTKSVLDLGLKTEFEIKKVTVICKLSSELIF